MKRLFLIIGFAIFVAVGAIFLFQPEKQERASYQFDIVASFYTLGYFAENIAGDRAVVTTIATDGSEPHEYEPTPRDVAAMIDADLLLYNGGGMDPWAAKIEESTRKKGGAILAIERKIPDISVDPHFWLDPLIAMRAVSLIGESLQQRDPANAGVYAQRAATLQEKLRELDDDFDQGLVACTQHDIIVSHNAYDYLGRRYGITIHSLVGISTEEEPSAARVAELANLAREKKIRLIFTEPFADSASAQTIAAEVGGQIRVLHPLESLSAQDRVAGKDYFSIMRENLINLQEALDCAS